MRSFPSGWSKVLVQLGFRRRVRKPGGIKLRARRLTVENLEERRVLSAAPWTATNESEYALASQALDAETPAQMARNFVLLESASSQYFNVTTAVDASGNPTALITLTPAHEAPTANQHTLTLELRLGETALASYEVSVVLASENFLGAYRADRLSKTLADLAPQSSDEATVIGELADQQRDADGKEVGEISDEELKTRTDAALAEAAFLTGKDEPLSAGERRELYVGTARAIDDFAQLDAAKTVAAVDSDAIQEQSIEQQSVEATLDPLSLGSALEPQETPVLNATERRALQENLGKTAIAIAETLQADLQSTDPALVEAAEALRNRLVAQAKYSDLVWQGYRVNSKVTAATLPSGAVLYTGIYESDVFAIADGISVKLDRPAVVDVTKVSTSYMYQTAANLGVAAGSPSSVGSSADGGIVRMVGGSSYSGPWTQGSTPVADFPYSGSRYQYDGVFRFDVSGFSQYVSQATVTLHPVDWPTFTNSTTVPQAALYTPFDDWNESSNIKTWGDFPERSASVPIKTVDGDSTWTVASLGGGNYEPVELDVTAFVRWKLRQGDMDVSGTRGISADLTAFELAVKNRSAYDSNYATKISDSTDVLDRGDINRDGVINAADGKAFLAVHGYLPGDANLDGYVSGSDFLILQQAPLAPSYTQGDFNFSGLFDGGDFAAYAENNGQTAPLPATEEVSLRVYTPDEVSTQFIVNGYGTKENSAGKSPSLAVAQTRDAVLTKFDTTTSGDLRVTYSVLNSNFTALNVKVYRSPDGVTRGDLLMTTPIPAGPELTPGLARSHTFAANFDSAAAFTPTERLIAVIEDGGSELSSVNNERTFAGAFKKSGTLYVMGGEGDDLFVLSQSGGNYLVNDASYSTTGVSAIQVSTHGGNDRVLYGSGTLPSMKAYGGDGNDILIGGTGVDELHGDAGHDILLDGSTTNTLDWGNAPNVKDSILVTTPTDENELSSGVVTANFGAGDISLREALKVASLSPGNDTIEFATSGFGVTTLAHGQLPIDSSVTINGPGASLLTIDANRGSRVLHVSAGTTVAISGLTITRGGNVTEGGGVLSYGNLTLNEVAVVDNEVGGYVWASGGGVSSLNAYGSYAHAQLHLVNSTVDGNRSYYGGGVRVQVENGGILEISGSTISNNVALDTANNGLGGGMWLSVQPGGDASITNSTFSGNSSGAGGGLMLYGSELTIVNSTIAYNHADVTGGSAGGIQNSSGVIVTMHNSILASNTATDATHKDHWGSVGGTATNRSSYNILGIQHTSISPSAADHSDLVDGEHGNQVGKQVGAGTGPIDPGLAPLANYGGTVKSHALLPGSSAIDHGSEAKASTAGLLSEQRGFSRVVDDAVANGLGGAVDVGAFEFRRDLIVTTLADADVRSGDLSLRQAINVERTLGASETITFDPGLNGTIKLGQGQLFLDNSITIDGPGADILAIDARGASRILKIEEPTGVVNVTLRGMTLTGGGNVVEGAGIHAITTGLLTLERMRVAGNSTNVDAAARGGGIYSQYSSLHVLDSTIENNHSTHGGGVMSHILTAGSSIQIVGSTISDNSAYSKDFNAGGGGLLLQPSHATSTVLIANSTISGNEASSSGGARINAIAGSSTKIVNSTFTNNDALVGGYNGQMGGGIDLRGAGSFELYNTIVAGNRAHQAYDDILSWATGVITAANDMVGEVGGSISALPGLGHVTLNVNEDPKLAPLGNYGGLTKTHMPLPASRAINAGNGQLTSQLTDQRGARHIRTLGGAIDIGAVEANVVQPTPASAVNVYGTKEDDAILITTSGGVASVTLSWAPDFSFPITLAGSVIANIYGYEGNDVIEAGPQISSTLFLFGGVGNDSLTAGSGNDFLFGEDGEDWLFAGDGDDALVGGDDADSVYGEDGDDSIHVDPGEDYVNDDVYDEDEDPDIHDPTSQVNHYPRITRFDDKRATAGASLTFTIQSTDADSGQSRTFSATGLPEGATLSPNGEFSWQPTEAQANQSYRITVTLTDAHPTTPLNDVWSFSVFVASSTTNHAPTIGNKTFNIAENSSAGAVVGTLTANDQDAGDIISLAIVSGDQNGHFEIDQATKQLRVASNAQLDFESKESYVLTVRAYDNRTPSMSATATVNVNLTNLADNTPPTIEAVETINIRKRQTAAVRVVATDAEDERGKLHFSHDGSWPLNALIGADDGLFFLPDAPAGTYSFPVKVVDRGGLSASTTITVVVADYNDSPPTLAAGATRWRLSDREDDLNYNDSWPTEWVYSNSITVPIYDPSLASINVPIGNRALDGHLVGSDEETPSANLTFNMLSGPDEFTLSASGYFEWTVTPSEAYKTHRVLYEIVDNGAPGGVQQRYLGELYINVPYYYYWAPDFSNGLTAGIGPAVSDKIALTRDQAITTSLAGNDSLGINYSTKTYVAVTNPSHDSNFVLSSNGTLQYTPSSGFSGVDRFSYKIVHSNPIYSNFPATLETPAADVFLTIGAIADISVDTDVPDDTVPGKYIVYNSDDDNRNGVPDFQDYFWTGDSPDDDLIEVHLAASIPEDMVDPSLVTFTLQSNYLNVWTTANKDKRIPDNTTWLKDEIPSSVWVEATSPYLGATPHLSLRADLRGSYKWFPAKDGFASDGAWLSNVLMDIDVDSLNNGEGPNADDRMEDAIEDDKDKPGAFLEVATADSDSDGIPDFADGFNRDGIASNSDNLSSGQWSRLTHSAPWTYHADATVTITYDASDPMGVAFQNGKYTPGGGSLRIWTKSLSSARNAAPFTGTAPGDYLAPGTYRALALPFELYLEGIEQSGKAGDDRIRFEIDPDGPGPAGVTTWDAVRVTVIGADLDVDSNNDGNISDADDLSEADPSLPGQWLPRNTRDFDGDGIPAYSDGMMNMLEEGKVESSGADDLPYAKMLLRVPKGIDYTLAEVYLTGPTLVQPTVVRDALSLEYVAPTSAIRVWHNGKSTAIDESRRVVRNRNPSSVEEGGNWVPGGTWLSLKNFHHEDSDDGATFVLYVEGLANSSVRGNVDVTATIAPLGHSKFISVSDAVQFTVYEVDTDLGFAATGLVPIDNFTDQREEVASSAKLIPIREDDGSTPFTPLLITISNAVDLSASRIRLNFDSSFRVWRNDGDEQRNPDYVQEGGDLISSADWYTLDQLGFGQSPNPRATLLYVQGIDKSKAGSQIRVELKPEAESNSRPRATDLVRANSGQYIVSGKVNYHVQGGTDLTSAQSEGDEAPVRHAEVILYTTSLSQAYATYTNDRGEFVLHVDADTELGELKVFASSVGSSDVRDVFVRTGLAMGVKRDHSLSGHSFAGDEDSEFVDLTGTNAIGRKDGVLNWMAFAAFDPMVAAANVAATIPEVNSSTTMALLVGSGDARTTQITNFMMLPLAIAGNWDNVQHEYGHVVEFDSQVRNERDVSFIFSYPHEVKGNGRTFHSFEGGRNVNEILNRAFTEGWANFFAIAAQTEGYVPAISREGVTGLDGIEWENHNLEAKKIDSDEAYGEDAEMAIARVLWDLYDDGREEWDADSRTLSDIMELTISAHKHFGQGVPRLRDLWAVLTEEGSSWEKIQVYAPLFEAAGILPRNAELMILGEPIDGAADGIAEILSGGNSEFRQPDFRWKTHLVRDEFGRLLPEIYNGDIFDAYEIVLFNEQGQELRTTKIQWTRGAQDEVVDAFVSPNEDLWDLTPGTYFWSIRSSWRSVSLSGSRPAANDSYLSTPLMFRVIE
jgi:hypothetical protein